MHLTGVGMCGFMWKRRSITQDAAPRDIAQCMEHGFSNPDRYRARRCSGFVCALKLAELESAAHIHARIGVSATAEYLDFYSELTGVRLRECAHV